MARDKAVERARVRHVNIIGSQVEQQVLDLALTVLDKGNGLLLVHLLLVRSITVSVDIGGSRT